MSKEKKSKKNDKAFGVPHIDPEEIHLKGLLGKGCFGKVYMGECRSIEVAVKVPKKQNLSKRTLRNFCKEVEIMSKIYHPNVCLFMGACTTPGNIRIVQEKLEGDLESRLHNLEMDISLSQRMQWAKEAAQGLAWLHGNNPPIVHRDLKPANLLLDEHNRIKVCDFGLSHFMEEGITDREPKGTPLYMAPEVMRKDKITEKVDQYSMGIILWELLTREDPFADHEDYDIFVNAVCNEGERPIIPTWCPESLRALITACWDESPLKRPTFPEIVAALDDVLEDAAIIEYEEKVDSAIQDPAGRYLWKRYFPYLDKVAWHDFAIAFYSILDLKLPSTFTRALDANSTDEQIRHATSAQLDEYSALNSSCAQKASAERQRRAMAAGFGGYGYMVDTSDSGFDDETRKLLVLKSIVADNMEETVTLVHFGKVLGWFGPLEVPAREGGFLDRLVEAMREPWFHGNINSRDTENQLRIQIPGTFLVRFSNNHQNSFCVSRISQGNVITHTVVPHVPKKGYKLDNQYFPTLPAMIEAKKEKHFLCQPCGGSKYQWLFEQGIAEIGGYGVDDS